MTSLLSKICQKSGSFLILLLLGLFTFVLLTRPILEMMITVPKNYNEGWNAFQSLSAFSGEILLYPDINSFISNNYPPLSFYIVGSLGSLMGDHIIAGRTVALASLFIVAIDIGLIIYRFSQSNSIALFSSLLFLAFMAAYYSNYVAMNDPQMLAHAFQLTGFAIFLASNQTVRPLILSLLFMFLGGLVKHNLIVLPIAITIWLFLYKRRSFYIWLVTSLMMLIGFGVVLFVIYGSNFFTGLMATHRGYNLFFELSIKIHYWFTPLVILIASALILLILDYSNRYTKLMALYASLAGVWGIFIAGGVGVNYNAIFDLIIALTLMSGLTIHCLGKIDHKRGLKLSLVQMMGMFILCLTILFIMPARGYELRNLMENLEHDKASATEDIAFMAEYKGAAMCESLALCYWAGKSFEVDIFNTGQKIITGGLSEKKLTDLLNAHYFAIIQMDDQCACGSQRFPENINQQILANYEAKRSSQKSGVFFLPKEK